MASLRCLLWLLLVTLPLVSGALDRRSWLAEVEEEEDTPGKGTGCPAFSLTWRSRLQDCQEVMLRHTGANPVFPSFQFDPKACYSRSQQRLIARTLWCEQELLPSHQCSPMATTAEALTSAVERHLDCVAKMASARGRIDFPSVTPNSHCFEKNTLEWVVERLDLLATWCEEQLQVRRGRVEKEG